MVHARRRQSDVRIFLLLAYDGLEPELLPHYDLRPIDVRSSTLEAVSRVDMGHEEHTTAQIRASCRLCFDCLVHRCNFTQFTHCLLLHRNWQILPDHGSECRETRICVAQANVLQRSV